MFIDPNITVEQKRQALADSGYLVTGKADDLGDSFVQIAYYELMKKLNADQMATLYPVGSKLKMDDGEDATCTGYNGDNAVFTQDVPKAKTYEVSLEVLRSKNLVSE